MLWPFRVDISHGPVYRYFTSWRLVAPGNLSIWHWQLTRVCFLLPFLGTLNEEAHRALLIDMFKRSSEIMKITLNGKYLSMNIPKYKWLLKIFLRLAALAAPNASPGKRMKAGRFDENTSLFFDTILNTELSHFATYLRLLDMPFSRSVGFLLRSTVRPVSCTTKRYPKQPVPSLYQIQLSATGTQLVKRASPLVKEAKFSVLQNSSPDPAHPDDVTNNLGKVMIYLHGGIFLGPSADSLENLYIKDFASASRNLTLINVDYPLSPEHRFPVALELLLDFYLWLTNCHEEVEKILGFRPKQIILSGDSSGANLSAALLVLLNDIRRDEELKIDSLELKMPSSVALFMPKMVIKLQFFPSFLCTLFDPFLSAVLLLRAGELYMPIRKKDPATGQWKLVAGSGTEGHTDRKSACGEEEDEPIHEEIPKDYVSHLEYDFVPSVYHSPLDYPHLNELSNVKLSILSATFDPLMDESIEVVRRWPGPVSLYVVDPCFHGIYGATLIMPKTTVTLLETCNSVIRDACTLSTSDPHDSSKSKPGAWDYFCSFCPVSCN